MRIKDILLQQEAPKYATVAWAKPINDSVQLNIYNKGEWHPINGSGNSGSGSSESGSGCNCNNVIIGYDTYNGTWKLVQGNFENALNTLKSNGFPINISIWYVGDTIKPHSIKEYFPASPNYSLPRPYNNLEIEEECIIIITDTMRTQDDIVVWDHNGISLYEESQTGGK